MAELHRASFRERVVARWDSFGLPFLFVALLAVFSILTPMFPTAFNLGSYF